MASFNGSSGSAVIETVKDGGNVIFLHISGWTFDWSRETADVTEFATADGWSATIPGLTKITGTLEGFYQDAAEDALVASEIVQDSIHLKLNANGSRGYEFTSGVNLTNFTQSSEIGQPNRWSCSFSSSVAPVIT